MRLSAPSARSVDLRVEPVDNVLDHVARSLQVDLDRDTVVRKRRSFGARTGRRTWVRIERRGLDKIGVQGWNGTECPKTDRMGFQENAAFIELRGFARSATDWAAKERKRIRDEGRLGKSAQTRRIERPPAIERHEAGRDSTGEAGATEPAMPELLTLMPTLPVQRQATALPEVPRERLFYRSLATAGVLAVALAHDTVDGSEADPGVDLAGVAVRGAGGRVLPHPSAGAARGRVKSRAQKVSVPA